MLHRYIRPILGERVLAALRPLDLQAVYQHITERGLFPRTVPYAHVLIKCAMQLADGLKAHVGHLCSRASTHAGRGCRKSRGNALSSDKMTNR